MRLSNSHARTLAPQDQENRRTLLPKYPNSQVEERKLKESISTHRQPLEEGTSDSLHVAKVESRALELQKKLDTQNYQIDTLSAETEHYMKLCDQQKEQLDQLDLELLRQEYDDQIRELAEEKEKISQLIFNLTEEYKEIEADYETRINATKSANSQLTSLVEQALALKETLLHQIAETDRTIEEDEGVIVVQEERIDELRNVERKLFIALNEMKLLEGRRN